MIWTVSVTDGVEYEYTEAQLMATDGYNHTWVVNCLIEAIERTLLPDLDGIYRRA
jgi:hypothetical protein